MRYSVIPSGLGLALLAGGGGGEEGTPVQQPAPSFAAMSAAVEDFAAANETLDATETMPTTGPVRYAGNMVSVDPETEAAIGSSTVGLIANFRLADETAVTSDQGFSATGLGHGER